MHPIRAPELMRQQNRASILAIIQEHGPISRIELAQLLDLNPATVTRITRALLEEGLITEIGEGTSQSAGRKPVLLEFNHRAQLLAGVVVRATEMTGIIGDLAGTVLSRRTALLSSQAAIEPFIEDLLKVDPSYHPRLTATCIGLSHPDATLLETLSNTLHVPVTITEPVRLSTLGEAAWGSAQGQRTFALFDLGSTSSVGVYLDGQTQVGGLGLSLSGKSLSARLCDAGLITQVKQALLAGEPSALCHMAERLSTGMIFEAARQHDPLALRVIQVAADELAWAAVSLADILSLDCVILGGTWFHAADILIPMMQDRMGTFDLRQPLVLSAGLGDEAPLLGAIKLLLDQVTLR